MISENNKIVNLGRNNKTVCVTRHLHAYTRDLLIGIGYYVEIIPPKMIRMVHKYMSDRESKFDGEIELYESVLGIDRKDFWRGLTYCNVSSGQVFFGFDDCKSETCKITDRHRAAVKQFEGKHDNFFLEHVPEKLRKRAKYEAHFVRTLCLLMNKVDLFLESLSKQM